MKHYILLILLVFVWIVSGCAKDAASTSAPVSPQPLAVENPASLMAALQSNGATVEEGASVTQPFFGPEGNIIKVNWADIQVFEYESVGAMENEAAQVAPDGGSIGTSMMMWVDAPHFYKAGRIIVLYVGSDQSALSLLEMVLGPQFAGR